MREMKDSGIEWIGEIPRNWEVSRIKYVCNNRSEKAQFDHEEDSYLGLENVVGFSDKIIETDTTYIDGYYDIYKSGDVLFNKLRPYLGKVIIAPYDGFCTGEFIRLYNYQGDNRFLRYWMIDEQFITEVDNSTYGAKMPRANPDFILNMPIAIVSSEEQHRISAYLDAKCAEIDALTADIQLQIDTLEQYKRSVITEAVTRGLDKDVEMKESGIEWIGKIPTLWTQCRIADVFRETNEKGIEGLPFLMVSINSGVSDHDIPDEERERIVIRGEDITKYKRVRPGDIVYNMMRAWQGAIGTARVDGVVSPAYETARPKTKLDSRYIEYLLRTPNAIEEMHKYSYGVADFRLRLYWPEFRNIHICLSSYEEQCEISDYCDRKSQEITSTINSMQKLITTLDSYKKSLIYEYVTGKKEVPV